MHVNMIGVAITRGTLTKLNLSFIPLPLLEEQKAIVEKVNALMGLCDGLEKEIEHSTTQVEQLMQRCLKEVFEPSTTAYHNHDQPPLRMTAEEGGEYGD